MTQSPLDSLGDEDRRNRDAGVVVREVGDSGRLLGIGEEAGEELEREAIMQVLATPGLGCSSPTPCRPLLKQNSWGGQY